ncbi:MAG TPA: hypothetical protein VFH00_11800 [Candidatus Nitrosotalea sp.]|nr:hypothetical protein [Candidatus Nitrosotalea sp.]
MSFEHLLALAPAGQFTLPAELIAAEAERVRLMEVSSNLRRTLPAWDGSARAELDADAIRAADNAADRADDRVRNFMRSNGKEIVIQCLRPAFDALIAETRKTCPKDSPATTEAAVRLPSGSRDYLRLERLAERYKAIMAAAQIIYGTGGRDNHRMFADTTAWPDRNASQYQYVEPRGPSEPPARLLWLAHAPDAKPFLPTNAERDAALNWFTTHHSVNLIHNAAINNT